MTASLHWSWTLNEDTEPTPYGWYRRGVPDGSYLTQLLNAIGLDPDKGLRRRLNQWIRMRRGVRDSKQFRPRLTFSQCAEDAILQTLVGNQPGHYLDIGSGHPIQGSNTYALYQQGWSGLLVDPLAANIDLSRRLRPRDVAVAALCGAQDHLGVDFYEYEIYEYSTASPERVKELAARGHHAKTVYELPVFSLASIVRQFQMSDARVLSIDVEGLERDVLRGNDWQVFRPEFVVIEEWYPPIPEPTDVYRAMMDAGYRLVALNLASTIYRAENV